MLMNKKIIGFCLFLAALLAPAAHAETVSVNPGAVGGNAQDFWFEAGPAAFVDIVWTDNKTLEYTSGTHLFFLYGPPCDNYAGILLDAAGNPIPDTELAGSTICTTGSDLSAGVIDLPGPTVFSGIRLISSGFNSNTAWQWNWEEDEKPVVGQTEASGNQPPVPDAGGPYEGVAGQPVIFDASGSIDPDGNITTYNWDFGDTNSLGGETIKHTYASAGKYNVILTVTDNDGVSASTHTIADIGNNSLRPTADAGGPYTGETGAQVLFDGTGSTDDGNITQYTWDFGDGSAPISGTATPRHTYGTPGTYYVVLTVTDDTGNTDAGITTATIADGNQAPVADAGPPVVGETGVPVSFDASASHDPDGAIVRYDWDYGDGNTGPDAGPTPSYTYGAPGDYTVSVTVTDDLDAVASDVTAASIDSTNVPPKADANGPYAGLVGEVISFDGTASTDMDGSIVQYDWEFGDSNTAIDAGPTPTNTYASAGNFTATLTVTDDDGLTNTSTATVSIAPGNQPPTADPNGPYSGIAGAAVSFDGSASNDADGSIVQYDWDFGDGNQAIDGGPTPSNTYAASGTYTVVLTVTDDGGLTNSSTTAAAIEAANQSPTADPNGPYTGTAGVAMNFDGSGSSDADGTIAQYDWDFGDGNDAIDGGPTPSNTYAAAGIYTVTLTVTDDGGATSSEAFTTAAIDSPNQPPVADPDGPYVGKVGVAVDFDGSGSSDADGSIAQYDWDFGDGNNAIDGGPTPSNTYAATGVYDVVLTVTDDSGDSAQSATQAIIGDGVNLPPTADAGGPYTGDEGVAVDFDGSASSDPDGAIARYDWDFGDGNQAMDGGPTPSNTYAAAGLYPVTLTVTDDGGATNTTTTVAAIGMGNMPPVADANGPYSGVIGLPVIFDGSGSSDTDGSIVQYDWDFGDGNSGSGVYASNIYTGAGTFIVTLIVTDNGGATDQTTVQVVIGDATGVNLPPTADANGPYTGVAGVGVTFDGTASDDPDGNVTDYDWEFGDGMTGNGPMPDNTYLSGGLYNVILQVTDDGGLVASDNALALIGEFSLPPTADAGGPYDGRVAVDVQFNGLGSDDPDGNIVQYDWDFGDGNDAIDGGPIATNNYAASGTYIVKLTVTDDSGETDTDATIVDVGIGNLPPQANAGDAARVKVRRDITFDGTGSDDRDGLITDYDWEFGDGNTGNGPTPTHSYQAKGTYFVTLTVTDNDGASSTDFTVVEVTKAGGGGGSSSDFLGCSTGSGETRDPTLPLLVLIALLYLNRRRAGYTRM